MGLIKSANKLIKEKFDFWYLQALKIFSFLIGIILGAYFPGIILPNLIIIVIVAVLMLLYMLIRLVKKSP